MLKVGVVGCGGVGLLHSKAYQSHQQADLVCVCDMVKEKADARAKGLGVKAYYSVKEMLSAESDLDVVGVITADHLRFEPSMEALEAGKHVLVEKPLSLKIEEAEQMVRKAEEKGVKLAIDYNRRYAQPYLKAKEWIDDGTVGNIAYVMMKLSQGGPATSHKGKYYLLYELETHALVNNIVESVSFFPQGDPVIRTWKPNIFSVGALTFDKIFENRIHAFVNDMIAGREPAPTGLDGLKALYAVEAAIKSHEEKRTIKVKEWK